MCLAHFIACECEQVRLPLHNCEVAWRIMGNRFKFANYKPRVSDKVTLPPVAVSHVPIVAKYAKFLAPSTVPIVTRVKPPVPVNRKPGRLPVITRSKIRSPYSLFGRAATDPPFLPTNSIKTHCNSPAYGRHQTKAVCPQKDRMIRGFHQQ